MQKTIIAFIGLSLIFFGCGVSYGVPFTDSHNFGGTGLFRANDYTRVNDRSTNSFTFDHALDPSAGTITSGSLTLNYSRVSPRARAEKWFVFVGDYKLGRLTGSRGKKWLSKTFVLPSSLLGGIGTNSAEIRLVESTKGRDSIFLDKSSLSLKYSGAPEPGSGTLEPGYSPPEPGFSAPEPGSSTPVPEPATSFLLGSGLVGLIAYRRLRN